MRLPADDSDGAPAEDFLYVGVDIGEIGRVVPVRRAASGADDGIELGLSFEHGVGKGKAGEHEGDECRGGGVGAGAEEVTRERGELGFGKGVLAGGVHEGFDVGGGNGGFGEGGFGFVLGEGFEGEGVEEVVPTTSTFLAAAAAAAVVGAAEEGEPAGEAGEDWMWGFLVTDGERRREREGNAHKERFQATWETSSPARSNQQLTASTQSPL